VLCHRLGDHVKLSAENAKLAGITSSAAGCLYRDCAQYYFRQGKLSKAELLFSFALTHLRSAKGQQNTDYETAITDLAALYCTSGRYDEARELYAKFLNEWDSHLGEKHSTYASAIEGLAHVYTYTQPPEDWKRPSRYYGMR
jgi:tetratricopeptide (TPR) repeat protein